MADGKWRRTSLCVRKVAIVLLCVCVLEGGALPCCICGIKCNYHHPLCERSLWWGERIHTGSSVSTDDSTENIYISYPIPLHLRLWSRLRTLNNLFNSCFGKLLSSLQQPGAGNGKWEEIKHPHSADHSQFTESLTRIYAAPRTRYR